MEKSVKNEKDQIIGANAAFLGLRGGWRGREGDLLLHGESGSVNYGNSSGEGCVKRASMEVVPSHSCCMIQSTGHQ